MNTVTVAAAQVAPVFLDREATVDKACGIICEAGHNGAQLVVFPEAYIPTYPDWVWAVPPGDGSVLDGLYAALARNAVTIPSAATDQLCEAARAAEAFVVVGMSELNTEASNSSLYNTLLYIDDHGHILGKHRKLVPTGAERLVWAQGDGSTLQAYDTALGMLGGLICWENYMPLARYAMYAWGTQIYVAATWDRSDTWLATLRHIAKEGRMYVIGCCMALRTSDIPDDFLLKEQFYANVNDWINVGNSAIVDPNGEFIAGPLNSSEGILYAEVDGNRLAGSKWMLDVAGHYARPDVFTLTIHDGNHPLVVRDEEGTDAIPSQMQST